jgi:hypothetical protein
VSLSSLRTVQRENGSRVQHSFTHSRKMYLRCLILTYSQKAACQHHQLRVFCTIQYQKQVPYTYKFAHMQFLVSAVLYGTVLRKEIFSADKIPPRNKLRRKRGPGLCSVRYEHTGILYDTQGYEYIFTNKTFN